MATIEELTGLIAGLSSVVKGLTTNVAEISTQVGQLTNAGISGNDTQATSNLKLPTLQLPEFRRDNEGFSEKSAAEQYGLCTSRLREEFEEPKQDKCRRLASKLSVMKQEPTETIEQFAFRLKNVLHQLDKLGESLTKLCPTYSIAQFISRVHPQISQHLIVKAEEFKQLDETIEAVRRIEQSLKMHEVKESNTDNNLSSSLSDWKPLGALSTQPAKGGIRNVPEKNPVKACYQCGDPSHLQRSCPLNKPVQQRPQLPPPKLKICRKYNRFLTSHCEQSNNKYSAGRLHKCLECNK
ncbi:PREDICTED: uncharacterized protein LOC107336333 [Paramuricea clavata]|uniref:PREDICTED: uncharacterized protein LOC107336333 n=1 Tax=Paramuricea clavata TaxID=317549 RepID=A0A7D9LU08_PARCT|nr:PREDICTED: uncharacterized protein LOC107336333 [Paramuricea clavata]